MLAHDLSVIFGSPSNSDTVELSMESLRGLVAQVEAELHRSEVYRRAVESLEENATEGTSAQFLLKSVSREAIRLALRQVLRQATPAQTNAAPAAPASSPSPTRRTKKASDQLQAEEAEYRQDCLRRLGEQIRKAREARSMSLAELHSKTLVPIHQLQAIEAGYGLHLPEDVYLRGFIQRIAKVLNVDGTKWLEILPTPDPVKSVLPSWYRPSQKSAIGIGGIALQPVHLYVGYAALMAGGCAWLSHQAAAPARNASELNTPHVSPATKSQAESTQKVSATVQVSPPESL